ncbi:MAG: glycosyltransferase family 2 protein [Bacilli bacterium]|nr:glycosyltransferase family 2 protein [Bacilli bacterium]
MIDIIIPAYNAHNTIEETLFSIAYQDIANNCNIYIVNDASDSNYDVIINFFSNFLNIKELKLEKNSGPGTARQFGIDNSNGKYIIFIDSDDVFSSPISISSLFNEINKSNYDVIISNFLEETDNGFIDKNNNTIWLHGKIYRREFLEKNNIKFNNSRSNEDNGFNQTILLAGAKTKYIDVKTYIWKNNKSSITRKNDYEFRYNGVLGYIFNIKWALDKAIKNNWNKKYIGELSYMSLIFIYFIYLEYYKKDDIKELLKEARQLKIISKKYDIDNNKKIELLDNQYKNYYNDDNKYFLLNPIITFNDFLVLLDKVVA